MATKLKDLDILPLHNYNVLIKLNGSTSHKSLFLVHYISQIILTKIKYMELKSFFSSDRSLWHLSMRMTQIS